MDEVRDEEVLDSGDSGESASEVVFTDQNDFLAKIHRSFLEDVQPIESGLMDELLAEDVLSSDEEHQVRAQATRRDTARKLWMLLHRIPPNLFEKRCLPVMKTNYPHVVRGAEFHYERSDNDSSGCFRHIVMKRVSLRQIADVFISTYGCTLQEYSTITGGDGTEKWKWELVFSLCKKNWNNDDFRTSLREILLAVDVAVPEDLSAFLSSGFPCCCTDSLHASAAGKDKASGATLQEYSVDVEESKIKRQNYDENPAPNSELRLVVFGKTGNGKSSTINTILGKVGFVKDEGLRSGTKVCRTQLVKLNGKNITIIDTPEDALRDPEEILHEISKCLSFAKPGPHALLFVVNANARFTQEEENAYFAFRRRFGGHLNSYVIVVFTHFDEFGNDEEKLKKMLADYGQEVDKAEKEGRKIPDLRKVLEDVNDRYVTFSNTADKATTDEQVLKLLETIQELADTNPCPYFEGKEIEITLTKLLRKIFAMNRKELCLTGKEIWEELMVTMRQLLEAENEIEGRGQAQLSKDQALSVTGTSRQKHSFPDSSAKSDADDKTTTSSVVPTTHTETATPVPAESCVPFIHREESTEAPIHKGRAEHPDMVVTSESSGEDSIDQRCCVKADVQCYYCSNDSLSSSESSSAGESEDDASTSGGGLHVSVSEQKWNHSLPSPMFSPTWQNSLLFTREGGFLRKSESDVILHVPADAVQSDTGVMIHAALCADVARIRRLLKLPDDEQVVSPLVEFWAGRNFKFEGPVSVALPHCLPTDFDSTAVQVYHVTLGESSHVAILEIKTRPRKGGDAYFSLSEDRITVFTDRFCGFVCTYCSKERKSKYRPELYVTASGSVTIPSDSLPARVDVYVHIWNRNMKVADFRQDNGIEPGPVKHLALLKKFKASQLELRMRSNERLTYRQDANGEHLHPGETKVFDLMPYFGCEKCFVGGRQPPVSHQWAMEFQPQRCPSSVLEIAIDVLNIVDDDTSPNQAKTTLVLTIKPVAEEDSTAKTLSTTIQASSNQQRPSTTRTGTDEWESTLVKQQQLATACSMGQFSDSCCPPPSDVPALPLQHRVSTGDTLNEEPLHQQNSVLKLPYEHPLSDNTSGQMVPFDSSRRLESLPMGLYNNCTFTIHANTHNNNVSKLGKMNTGNTNYNTRSEAKAEALDYAPQQLHQQGDIPVVEMPDDGSLRQLRE